MSINATIESNKYEGIEMIEVGGKTIALEQEITGTKTITENGTHDVTNFAQAVVNVAANGGGTNVEQGSFVGNGAGDIEIEVSNLKENIFIYIEDFTTLDAEIDDKFSLTLFYGNSELSHCLGKRADKVYNAYTGVGTSSGGANSNYVVFSDTGISIKGMKAGGAGIKLRSDYTYKWIAW